MNEIPRKQSFLNTYAAPLRELLLNDTVTEVVVNSDGHVWVEIQGSEYMTKAGGVRIDKSLSE